MSTNIETKTLELHSNSLIEKKPHMAMAKKRQTYKQYYTQLKIEI